LIYTAKIKEEKNDLMSEKEIHNKGTITKMKKGSRS